jgi:hypothetical protein
MLGLDYLPYERLMHVAVPHVLEPLVGKTLSRHRSYPEKTSAIRYDCTVDQLRLLNDAGSALGYNMSRI